MPKLLSLVSIIFISSICLAGELKLISTTAFKSAGQDIIPAFETLTGVKVQAVYYGTVDLKKHIEAGENFDYVISARPVVDGLVKMAKADGKTVTNLIKSGLAVAVPGGHKDIDISTPEKFKSVLLAASLIGYSTGQSGDAMIDILKQIGIYEQLGNKLKQMKPGYPVGEALTKGEIEIGFQQLSEFLPFSKIKIVGAPPATLQKITVYSGARLTNSKEDKATTELARFIRSGDARKILDKNGLQPAE